MNKKFMLISIICLMIFSVNYTYSVFSNKIVGNISATSNDWRYIFNVTGGVVENDYYKLSLSGSSGSFDVVVDSSGSNNNVEYSIKFNESNLSGDVVFYRDSGYSDEIVDNLYKGTLSKNNTNTITIYWKSSSSVSGNVLISSEGIVYTLAMMKNGNSKSTEFWNSTYKKYISTIDFNNDLSNLPEVCDESNLCWDVSYDSNQVKKVYAYLVDSGSTDSLSNTLYNLYIVSENKIYAPVDCSSVFSEFTNLTSINFNNNFDTSNVTYMMDMFFKCSSLTSLDISSFNTSNITTMEGMFCSCSSLTSLDISSFNTSNVTTMDNMFNQCSSLTNLDLSNFNTSNVTNMQSMFNYCSSLTSLDVNSFDTSKVTNMLHMFLYCSKLTSLDLSSFNTSNVTNMYGMFHGCSSLTSLDLSNFDTSNVTSMSHMLYQCSSLTNLDLSNFDTSNVTKMDSMFGYCKSLTSLNVSSFDTSSVTNMSYMFYSSPKLTTTINIMSTGVTNYGYMFNGAATASGALITVNYIADASTLVDNMIATGTGNIVKGTVIS